ncbi:MAG: DoxX-like family protein [Burkholderiaceae bacterium]
MDQPERQDDPGAQADEQGGKHRRVSSSRRALSGRSARAAGGGVARGARLHVGPTARVSALFQRESGVMHLLARCGFDGVAGEAALVASCTLNLALGLTLWLRPSPWVFAAQAGAVLGYTVTAALHMPELVIDHCGLLVKNLPVLALVLLLWLAHGSVPAPSAAGRE